MKKRTRVYAGIYRYFTMPVYTLRNTPAPCRERNIYYPRIQSADPIGRTRSQRAEFRSPALRWACYGSQGKKTRVVRSRNSGSEILKLQSISWGNTQKLRSLFPAPQRRATRPPWRVRLLLPLARHLSNVCSLAGSAYGSMYLTEVCGQLGLFGY